MDDVKWPLIRLRAYQLSGMVPAMWGNAHTRFRTPFAVAAIYLGSIQGTRTWHLFEVQYDDKEAGVLLMPTSDLNQLTVEEL